MGLDEIRKLKKKAREEKVDKGFIAKRSPKRVARMKEDLATLEKDNEFYQEIWSERPHVCFETGEKLPQKLRKWNFHHCLEKSDYPQFRYAKWNIVLVTQMAHDQVMVDIDKTPRIKKYTETLKRKYGID